MSKKRSIQQLLPLALLIMCWPNNGYAQVKDTLTINNEDLDSPIYYSAKDSLYADLKKNQVHLYGSAVVDNGEINLKAGYILIDLDKKEVLAQYRLDADSSEIEHPVFVDGTEQIDARKVRYNFDSEKAFIEEVAIQQDENYLYMGVAKRHSNEEIHFEKGRFTTCNLDDPHYHFQLSRAVMIPEKRIVSGPMNLWVKGVPTPIGLPFSIIPQVEDKTKGLVFPEVVPLSQYGFGFQDLGYYYPINDRLQTTIYASLYSRGSWGLRNQTDYARIYKYRGALNFGFQQFRSGFPENVNQNKITVYWNHRTDTKSSPYWNFTSNVNFISDNQSQNNLDPLNEDYFKNSFNSDINLTRLFPGKPITAGAKISLRQNSSTNNISLASPVVNLNVSRFFPFKKLVKNNKGWGSLFGNFGVTYSLEGQNRTLFGDSLLEQGYYDRIAEQFQNGISQKVTAQTTAGLFKNTWKLTPSASYGNKINFQTIEKNYDGVNDEIIIDTNQVTGAAQDLSLNIKLTTALYSYYRYVGKRQPLLRHVLTPSFSFNYVPNLNPLESYIDGDGNTIEYSQFERSLYSVGTTRDQALISFGFNNTFELKIKSDKDTIDGFKRTRIIDLFSIAGNYDLLKDSMNLSELKLNLRISPFKWVNIVSTSSFSPYEWDQFTGSTQSDYAINSKGPIGRFMSTNIATTLTITSKTSRKEIDKVIEQIDENWNADFEYYMLHPEYAVNFNIPWKLSFSHVYGITANQNISTLSPDRYNQVQTVMVNGDVSFTKRWKLTTRTNLDLKDLQVTNTRFSLNRDMHCWALAFHWTPIGGNKSFLFSIRSTSTLFQDAKIDIRKPPAFL